MAERSIQFRTGYKRGGSVEKGGTTTPTPKKKEPGKIKKFFGKIRKKIAPTFGEQAEEARKAGKKTFKSERHKKKGSGWTGETLGKLEYSSDTKEMRQKARKKESRKEQATRKKGQGKQVGLTDFQGAYKTALKAGKTDFTHKGKKFTTLKKGEKKKKPFVDWKNKKINITKPELSGGTAKKIKRAIGAQGGGRIADAARRAQIHGFYSPDMGMGGRDPRMGMRGRGPGPGMARGRGYAKGGLIKGKPKLAVKGW